MIINKSDYNPMPVLVPIITQVRVLTPMELDLIQHELFKGGIVPEDGDEFKQTLTCLIETIKEKING
jgi:hypothetical protein